MDTPLGFKRGVLFDLHPDNVEVGSFDILDNQLRTRRGCAFTCEAEGEIESFSGHTGARSEPKVNGVDSSASMPRQLLFRDLDDAQRN